MIGIKIIFLEEFGKAFVPKRVRPHLHKHFLKAGITAVPYRVFGGIFYLAILITALLYLFFIEPYVSSVGGGVLVTFLYTILAWIIIPLAAIAVLSALFYIYLDLKIFNRTKDMEAVLPDFLRFVSENLKGGMPFERALWSAIRPEFGVLANEVRLAAKRVMTGQDIDDALHEFTSKYDSPLMRRSFDIIIEGIRGGGEIADLIDRVVENLDETHELKEEMRTTNITYVIFIIAIVVIIAPMLFSLSYYFLSIVQGFGERLGGPGAAASLLPVDLSNSSIELGTFEAFSRYSLAVLAIFSAAIVSLINRGTIRGGVKYFPIFLITSQIAYTVFLFVGGIFFAGLVQ